MQESFLLKKQAPSAGVLRVQRKQPAAAVETQRPAASDNGAARFTDASAPTQIEESTLPLEQIVGTIVERAPVDPQVAPPSPPSAAGNAAFPAAVHRRQSKFSLSRAGKQGPLRQAAPVGAVGNGQQPGLAPVERDVIAPIDTGNTEAAKQSALHRQAQPSIDAGLEGSSAAPGAGAASRQAQSLNKGLTQDVHDIDDQNRKRVAAMTVDEVSQAREHAAHPLLAASHAAQNRAQAIHRLCMRPISQFTAPHITSLLERGLQVYIAVMV